MLLLAMAMQATEVGPGSVSGHWYASGNPYNVNGEINVPVNSFLIIHEGVHIIFQGHYKFNVDSNATLQAVGTRQDSITITAANTITRWHGIRFMSASNQSYLEYCHLSYGLADGENWENDGGAMNIFNCSPRIENCTINNCSASQGGALFCEPNCTSIVRNCVFKDNHADYSAGAIYMGGYGSNMMLENNLVIGNSTNGWGGGITCGANHEFINNTITNNDGSIGSGIYMEACLPILKNCIVWGNNGGTEFVTVAANPMATYSCIAGGYSGTGNINQNPLWIGGPYGPFYLMQPPVQQDLSPCVNAGDPASSTIFGTTRTDGVQDAGIVDMGYHYPLPYQPTQIDVTLTPINPTIVVPAQGGSFEFDASVVNYGPNQSIFWVWARILGPGGIYYLDPALGPVPINPPINAIVTRHRIQNVPGIWPAGEYMYIAYANWTYSYPVIDSSWFTFSKSTTGDGGPTVWEPICYGEPFPGEQPQIASLPLELELGSSPNPFNPATDIGYELQAPSQVSLNVYDTAGRLVATLVEGWREAGTHAATFDGSRLPSGLYFARLTAGNYTATQKLILLK